MYTNICIEGIDKTGKGIVAEYVKRLSNHKYTVFDRGVMSEITYARIFKRDQTFDIEPYKRFVFVYLTVDEDDWKIRCKLTNEPTIEYRLNLSEFNKTADDFKSNGYDVIEFNTSNMTPFNIAKNVIEHLEKLNSKQKYSQMELF